MAKIEKTISFFSSKIWYSYQFFKKLGIKTPKFEYFYGNFRELRKQEVIFCSYIKMMSRQGLYLFFKRIKYQIFLIRITQKF